jgi:hypothetical protein
MAIIYTYPTASPTNSDNILGSRLNPVTEEQETVQFGIGEVAALAANNYVETTVTVTTAQLTALETTDVTLIAAPGANKYIKVLAASAFLDYTAPVYTFAATLNISVNGINQTRLPNTFGQSNADTVFTCGLLEGVVAANTALKLTTSGAVGGGGNSSMQIKIRYQILDTASF